ncbi:flagellar hook-length control protein FliK [Roseibaca sp. Y0-43]|nr:flagellar hook-length control protein FliK [Roseibaca sp. Y0-43]
MDRVPIRAGKETSGNAAPVLGDGAAFLRQFQDSALPAKGHAPLTDVGARAGGRGRAEGDENPPETAVALPTEDLPTQAPHSVAPTLLSAEAIEGDALSVQAAGEGIVMVAQTLPAGPVAVTDDQPIAQTPVIAARSDGFSPVKTVPSGPIGAILSPVAPGSPGAFSAHSSGGMTVAARIELPGGMDERVSSPMLTPVLAVKEGKTATPPVGPSQGFVQPFRAPFGWRDLEKELTAQEARASQSKLPQASENLRPSPALALPVPGPMAEQMLPGAAIAGGEALPAGFDVGADGIRVAPPPSGPGSMTAATALPVAQSSAAQVAQAIATAPGDQIEITLSPDELGRVRIQMHQSDIGLQVVISGERPETLDLLRKNITLLARALSELGYEQASFSFGEQGRGQSDRPGRPASVFGMTAENAALVEIAAPPNAARTSGLDLRI